MIHHGIIRKSPIHRVNVTNHAVTDSSHVMEVNRIREETDFDAIMSFSGDVLPGYRTFLPEFRDEDASSLAIKGTQLELLKYLVGLISNGHRSITEVGQILALARDRWNLDYIDRFLASKEWTVRAFREKLLWIAIGDVYHEPNVDLLRVVLNSGEDVEAKNVKYQPLMSQAFELLDEIDEKRQGQLVISESRLEVVVELIACGADWTVCYFEDESVLDIMIEASAHVGVNMLLDLIQQSPTHCSLITVHTFIVTTIQGDTDLFQQLCLMRPTILADLKRTPWLLFEVAALGKNSIKMIEFLLDLGLDITAADKNGRGNPLVLAPLSDSTGVFEYLVRMGVSINRYASGDLMKHLSQDSRLALFSQMTDYDLNEAAPIHTAVHKGNDQAVEYLLEHGVDPNQRGFKLPIQLAARLSDSVGLTIMGRLIAAGAIINATAKHPRTCRMNIHNYYGHHKQGIAPYQTALLIAISCNNIGAFRMLRNHDAELPGPPLCSNAFCPNSSDTARYSDSSSDIASKETEESWVYGAPDRCDDDTAGSCSHVFDGTWNPLFLAVESRSKELILDLLEEASPELIRSWTTENCFRHMLNYLNWVFITQLIEDGTLDSSYLEKADIRSYIIRTRNKYWSHYLIITGCLDEADMMKMFINAVKEDWSAMVRTFLDKGLWPDGFVPGNKDSRDHPDIFGSEAPLRIAMKVKARSIRDIMLKYYVDALQSDPTHFQHFAKAHAIALSCGDIEFANEVNPHGNINTISKCNIMYQWCKSDLSYTLISSVQLAIHFKQYTTAEWLTSQGADPNISCDTQDGASAYHSPLQCVVKDGGPTALVTTLINGGADVNHRPIDIRGATALQFAAMNGNIGVLKLLLEAGADVNAPPCRWEGRTAIEGAAELGRLETVSILLEAGANVEGKANVNYRRTIYRAWAHGHHVLVEMVQEWRKERFGIEHYQPTESIIRSMDMKTLGYTRRDQLLVPDPSEKYFSPCYDCSDGLPQIA